MSAHGAKFEVWTPYLKSNGAFVLGHRYFYNEDIWKQVCIEYPHIWFKGVDGTLRLDKFCYVLFPNIEKELEFINIPASSSTCALLPEIAANYGFSHS